MTTLPGRAGGFRFLVDANTARRQAAAILSERRFQVEPTPRPFAGVLSWFGARLRAFGRPFGWVARRLSSVLPGGGSVVWILLTLLGIGALAVAMRRLGVLRRRRLVATSTPSTKRLTADELEGMAGEAEGRGDLDTSVRLRFRAGLRRLADGRVINGPEQRTNGEIGRQLGLGRYTSLADRMDAVTYASSAATPDDVLRARTEWPTVVREGISQRIARSRSFPSNFAAGARPTGRGPVAQIKRRRFDRTHR